jgi:hypothetical protein
LGGNIANEYEREHLIVLRGAGTLPGNSGRPKSLPSRSPKPSVLWSRHPSFQERRGSLCVTLDLFPSESSGRAAHNATMVANTDMALMIRFGFICWVQSERELHFYMANVAAKNSEKSSQAPASCDPLA